MIRSHRRAAKFIFHACSGPRVGVWVGVRVYVGVKVRIRFRNILDRNKRRKEFRRRDTLATVVAKTLANV